MLLADEWQEELAARISSTHPQKCLEAGSGHGLTSLLANTAGCRRFLLDLEPSALLFAQRIFDHHQQDACFTVGDLFRMPFGDRSFDVVFNSGVLEHFEYNERIAAVQEMVRTVRPGGKVIIGLPNHYSYPYRYSYEYRQRRNEWPYPDEHRIYDLSDEIQSAGLQVRQQRETVSRKTSLHFLRRHQRMLFRLLGVVKPYEGYLTILTLTRE